MERAKYPVMAISSIQRDGFEASEEAILRRARESSTASKLSCGGLLMNFLTDPVNQQIEGQHRIVIEEIL